MTKKDYEAAAKIVQETNDKLAAGFIEDAFATLFANDSPRFDIARFRAACVPGANVKARGTRTDRYRYEASEG